MVIFICELFMLIHDFSYFILLLVNWRVIACQDKGHSISICPAKDLNDVR